ncbi:PIN domain-containing protein [Paraconexibacter antarcticus]|uniref:PIN domain-containing protein n=1 Tax=Paraconexibacter antarcticus TaxID=2949664 RepID=A0ABY5DSV3_9ACTN|nr:PIN domain-containing protein [Paraconexibacter antarcticus]UTI65105.1 PIN domain-containing protein [Paraconexibacter antarcticus]
MPEGPEATGPLRCLVDTMIFDAIVEEPALLEAVDRLTSAGTLQLLADTVSVAQVAAAPPSYHRTQLRRVRVLVVPPADTDPVLRPLAASTGVGEPDALIAAAARAQGVPLVTEDGDLRRAAAVLLPDLVLWTWAADLRPRLVALAAELPPRRPR